MRLARSWARRSFREPNPGQPNVADPPLLSGQNSRRDGSMSRYPSPTNATENHLGDDSTSYFHWMSCRDQKTVKTNSRRRPTLPTRLLPHRWQPIGQHRKQRHPRSPESQPDLKPPEIPNPLPVD